LFKGCFSAWVEGLREAEPDIIAIEGKTSRRSHARGKGRAPLHLVSAWASRQRLVIGQQACEAKSNEITTIPLLLERLKEIRDRLEFIDGHCLPLVSDGNGRVTAWLFAGGLVSASVARALNEDGVSTVGWDDVSVTARTGDIETLSHALARVDPVTAHPALPNDLATALKFGLCLPPRVAEEVTIARTSSAKDIADALESVRKHQAGLQSFLSMRRIEARRRNASALRLRFSQSLASLRQRLSQAMVRSTIQRLGNTTNPLA
jgi:hypothetical protein